MANPLLSQPLFFKPVYKDYLWGGTRIAEQYKRKETPSICAESWEISAHSDGMSVVSAGPLQGQTLEAITKSYGKELLGSSAPSSTKFPLLIKIIDARENLSVQVHPSPCDPSADKDEIKNECWYSLNGEGYLYGGFQEPFNKREVFELARVANEDSIGGMLAVHQPAIGDVLNIPAGLVHAIGAGSLIYEVQQCSNTTYRFYDWGRVDTNGIARELHLAQAMHSIDWSLPTPRLLTPEPTPATSLEECIKTPYFRVLRLRKAAEPYTIYTNGESFHALFTSSGGFTIVVDGIESHLPLGDSALIPAAISSYTLVPDDQSSIALITTL